MNPVEEFLFVKEAQEKKEAGLSEFISGMGKAFRGAETTATGALGHAFGQALPGALITAGMGATAYGISKAVGAAREHFGKQKDYQAMLDAGPGLKKRPARQVQMLFNSLRKMSPSMSSDPVIAASFVENQMDITGNRAVMAPNTAKMLAETQRSVAQGKGPNPLVQMFQPGYFPKPEGGPEYSAGARGLEGRGFGSAEEAAAAAARMGIPSQGYGSLRTEYEVDPRTGDPGAPIGISATRPY